MFGVYYWKSLDKQVLQRYKTTDNFDKNFNALLFPFVTQTNSLAFLMVGRTQVSLTGRTHHVTSVGKV